MDIGRAKEILSALAEGVDPTTGEILPENSICNRSEVVRALYAVLACVDVKKPKRRRPEKAGKPWIKEDEALLVDLYQSGATKKDICSTLKRTETGVAARLVHLGIIESRDIFREKMIKEVVHDPILLGVKSEPATKTDLWVAQDLLDTLTANKDTCVGMAANMIGVCKRIIAFDNEGTYMTMFNPEIIKKSEPYDTEEGCLSLLGGPRPCKRFKTIKVRWQTAEFKTRVKTFTGWPAQIIQHEVDHCDGVLI